MFIKNQLSTFNKVLTLYYIKFIKVKNRVGRPNISYYYDSTRIWTVHLNSK